MDTKWSTSGKVLGLKVDFYNLGLNNADTTAPDNPEEGEAWYDTTNNLIGWYDGSDWYSNLKCQNLRISSDVVNSSGNRVLGFVPVGTIVPWIGGYFTNGSNGGYTRVLGSANTPTAANTYLNSYNWYVCNGAAINISSSPIFNGASRYLPNLTDDRFIMGDSYIGASGGNTNINPRSTFAATGSKTIAATGSKTIAATGSKTIAATGSKTIANSGSRNIDHSHNQGSLFTCWRCISGAHPFTEVRWNQEQVSQWSADSYINEITGIGVQANTPDLGTDILGSTGTMSANTSLTYSDWFAATSLTYSDWFAATSLTYSDWFLNSSVDLRPKYLGCFYIMKV